MVDLGIITGSGFYDFPGLEGEEKTVSTEWGNVVLTVGTVHKKEIVFISRHKKGHKTLPHLINHRANLLALKNLGVKAIISTTVCGMLDGQFPLAQLIVFDDLYFPDNRLPSGEICSIFKGGQNQGHYLFTKPYSGEMRKAFIDLAASPLTQAIYAHVNGPRFNSRAEIKMLKNHATCLSQTAGPEIILAGELEIPIILLGYAVDYANGVKKDPTPIEVLTKNLYKSKTVFADLISKYIKEFTPPSFEGFVYRFS